MCVAFNTVWGAAARLTVCSLAARWGLCTFILMDALCFSSSLLWDAGGHAERLDSSPAAGRVSPPGSRTFQPTRCLLRFLVRTGENRCETQSAALFSVDLGRRKTNDDLRQHSSDRLLENQGRFIKCRLYGSSKIASGPLSLLWWNKYFRDLLFAQNLTSVSDLDNESCRENPNN